MVDFKDAAFSEVTDRTKLPWLDPTDENAERDGKPAHLYSGTAVPSQGFTYKPGYALGRGPRPAAGYYSFETIAAYNIVIQNLLPKKRGQQIKSAFSKKAKKESKTTKDMLAFCKARLKSDGPHTTITKDDMVKYGGDPEILTHVAANSSPFSTRDLSIAGQSGNSTLIATEFGANRRTYSPVWLIARLVDFE